jgi:hypothetical protein
MKHGPYVGAVLAILGIAVLVVSMTVLGQTKAILGVVLGGVLVQVGIAAFIVDWPKVE